MKLQTLSMSYFRKATELTVTMAGKDMEIHGRNTAGKSTIADLYFWTLFGKNSLNQANFDIKTTKNGKVIPNIDHVGELKFTMENGEEFKVKRVYKEVWTAPRAKLEKEVSGHTTDYFVNGVGVNEGEYKRIINDICSEEKFRTLGDPTYFPTLDWKKQRAQLLGIYGDVTQDDVIKANSKLKELPSILGSHSVDDYRKIVASRKKEIKEERDRIPARIDELTKGIPEDDEAAPVVDIEALKSTVRELQGKRAQLESGGAIADKTVELKRIQGELLTLEQTLKKAASLVGDELNAELRAAQSESTRLFGEVNQTKAKIENAKKSVTMLAAKMATLREEFAAINSRNFTFDGSDTCAACKQALPSIEVDAAKERARDDFNGKKSKALEDNQTTGKGLKKEKDELEQSLTDWGVSLARLTTEEEAANLRCSDLRSKIDRLGATSVDLSKDKTYTDKLAEKAKVEGEIESLKSDDSSALDAINKQIASAEGEVTKATEFTAKLQRKEEDLARIKKHEDRQLELSKEYEKLESHFALTEEYIRAWVRMLSEKINSQFKITSFKLFNELQNGGLEECCEATIDGRPYSTSLSNSERINVGLDIIDTLSRHYGFAPPIFIDNCESVSEPLPTLGQQIRLIVSPQDKTLRFVSLEGSSIDRANAQQELISA